ncbi:MAG: ABC transporter permease [Nanoarchaeota archaeon]
MIGQAKAMAYKMSALPRTIWTFIIKDVKLLFKKKKYLYLSLALPLLLGLIYVSMLGTTTNHPNIIVCDQEDTAVTQEAMASIEGFDITRVTGKGCENTIKQNVTAKQYVFGVVIAEGFTHQLDTLQQANMIIYYDNSDPSLSSLAQWKFDNAITPYKKEIIRTFSTTLSERAGNAREKLDSAIDVIAQTTPARSELIREELDTPREELKRVEHLDTAFVTSPINVEKRGIHTTDFAMIDLGLPPLFTILNLFLVLMLAATGVIYERRNKIFHRIRTSISTMTSYVFSKAVVFTMVTVVQFLLLLGLFVAFGASFTIDIELLAKALAFIGIVNTMIGVLIGFIADSEGVAVLISLIFTLPLLFLSGMFYPVDMLPGAVRALASITPLQAEIMLLKQAILFEGKAIATSFIAPIILFLITAIASRKVE